MKRTPLVGMLTILAASTLWAQRPPIMIRDHRRPAVVAVNVSGAVSGRPQGRSFMLASGRGRYLVDASHAVTRFHGRFFSISNLTSGSFVVAHGTIAGSTLVATSVDVTRLAGLKIPVRRTTLPRRGG